MTNDELEIILYGEPMNGHSRWAPPIGPNDIIVDDLTAMQERIISDILEEYK